MLAYVDTSIWITSNEGLREYRKTIDNQLNQLKQDGWRFCISYAVILETLYHPIRDRNIVLINSYKELFAAIKIFPNYSMLFEDSIRYMHKDNLKTIDAIHDAFANHYGCDGFVSTDPDFKNLRTIQPLWIDLATA